MKKQRAILEAAIDGSLIRGTLTTPTGEQRGLNGRSALDALRLPPWQSTLRRWALVHVWDDATVASFAEEAQRRAGDDWT